MDARTPGRGHSIPEILQRTFGEAAGLVSGLGRLAVAEMSEGVGAVAKGIISAIAGLGAAMIGLLFLLHAAVAYLVLRGFSEAAAYGMVGGGIFVIGALALLIGVWMCTKASPLPRRTFREARSLFGNKEISS